MESLGEQDYVLMKWRIYVDTDFVYGHDISLFPAIYSRLSPQLLNILSKIHNRYVFYYVLLF